MTRVGGEVVGAGRCFGTADQGLWFDVGALANIRKTERVLTGR